MSQADDGAATRGWPGTFATAEIRPAAEEAGNLSPARSDISRPADEVADALLAIMQVMGMPNPLLSPSTQTAPEPITREAWDEAVSQFGPHNSYYSLTQGQLDEIRNWTSNNTPASMVAEVMNRPQAGWSAATSGRAAI